MPMYVYPESTIVKARIHSLQGEFDYVRLVESDLDSDEYIVIYDNLKCTARWSKSKNVYFVDDVDGIIEELSEPW